MCTPGPEMRKLHPLIAGASAAAVLALACPRLAAQTTFGASNDPSATLAIEHADAALVVSVRRLRRSAGQLPFSSRTVLRDAVTGIAHPLRGSTVTISPDGRYESVRARFDATAAESGTFDLIDPIAQQRALYITRVREGDTGGA